MQSCARQIQDWRKFLPGHTSDKWSSKSKDPTNGLVVKTNGEIDNEQTDKLRSDFEDFLTFVASYCPTGFMTQVTRESTSYEWIIEQLYTTFG